MKIKAGSIYGECLICKKLTPHASGKCVDCRSKTCSGCGKKFSLTTKSAQVCVRCNQRRKLKAHQFEGACLDKAVGV